MVFINSIKEAQNILKYGKIHPILEKSAYYEFKSKEEAESWGKANYSEWAITHKNIFWEIEFYQQGSRRLYVEDPVKWYLGNGFYNINKYLRTGKSDDFAVNLPILISNLMVSVFSAPVIEQKIILYRQVPAEMINEMIKNNKESFPYREKGFMSTSMLKTVCAENCGNSPYMLKLYVDDVPPIHAIYANETYGRDEVELLLQPDLCMQMAEYPYKDTCSGKIIYEVLLSSINMRSLYPATSQVLYKR